MFILVLLWNKLNHSRVYFLGPTMKQSWSWSCEWLESTSSKLRGRHLKHSATVIIFLNIKSISSSRGGVQPKIQIKRTPKGSPKQHNCKCCRLGLIEPVRGRRWKVPPPWHRLKHNITFKHGYCKFWMLKHPYMCHNYHNVRRKLYNIF